MVKLNLLLLIVDLSGVKLKAGFPSSDDEIWKISQILSIFVLSFIFAISFKVTEF